tara:strand:+ start:1144 stop:1878 length:735 start_codon:yes stop_codon:yes gene_type:complete
MKFKLFFLLIFLFSCTQSVTKKNMKQPFTSKGFAYIFNLEDYNNNLIKKKLNENELQIAHNKTRIGSLIKITNPKTAQSVVLKNNKNFNYSDFYKIIITQPVADTLKLDKNKPYVEITEIKKNKSFIAKKTKIFNEEKKVHTKAPVEIVKIDNISLNKSQKKKISEEFNIIIAEFYSKDSATFLKKRITSELPSFNSKKLYIKSSNLNKISLLSGPYKSINVMKNDYIQLEKFGFEELDIGLNE